MSFWALLSVNTKMQLRNRSALFWHFAFPLIFIVLFGLINGNGGGNVDIGINSNNPGISKAFEQAASNSKNIKLIKGSKDELIKKLKQNKLDIAVSAGNKVSNKPVDVQIFYDPSGNLAGDAANGVVTSVLDEITKTTFKVPKLFEIKKKSVSTDTLNYISFLMPGVIGMSIMFSAMNGTSYPLVNEREKGILRRLRMTLMKPVSFIAAKSVGMVIIAFMQTVIIIAAGVLIFDVKIIGSYVDASFVVFVGCLMMVSLGFFVASISKRLESVDAISNSIAMPMMFLAGTFFPTDGAPAWLRSIAKLLPLTYLNDSLRDILVKGKTLMQVDTALMIMAGWALFFIILAVYFFKWETPAPSKTK